MRPYMISAFTLKNLTGTQKKNLKSILKAKKLRVYYPQFFFYISHYKYHITNITLQNQKFILNLCIKSSLQPLKEADQASSSLQVPLRCHNRQICLPYMQQACLTCPRKEDQQPSYPLWMQKLCPLP